MNSSASPQPESRWPHRFAVLLCCATFPLIWVGGLVTTHDAGMAVPDWPTTYGYNMFAYPLETWLYGPWDLFIEHGHRLLGATVGLLTIAMVVTVYRGDRRRWVRCLAVGALGLVIAQGVLGGMRVVADDRFLAKVHACVGPAFFALCISMAVFTSGVWKSVTTRKTHARAGLLQRVAFLTALFSYLQLIAGAQLRHVAPDASPSSFRTMVFFHLLMAVVVTVHIVLIALLVVFSGFGEAAILRPAMLLCILIAVQLALGVGTWVVNYAWPSWVPETVHTAGYTIQAKGLLQSNVVTGHVAAGSLIIAVAVQLALRCFRLLRPTPAGVEAPSLAEGVAA